MRVEIVTENKKDFLDLLLLADESEAMIDKYLERGVMFALYDGDLKTVCVVTDEGGGTFELQNIATYEKYQRMGYGRYLVGYICDYFAGKADVMLVGTGDTPMTISFYESCGFAISHRLENYILEHYGVIYDNGTQLIDKVYLAKAL